MVELNRDDVAHANSYCASSYGRHYEIALETSNASAMEIFSSDDVIKAVATTSVAYSDGWFRLDVYASVGLNYDKAMAIFDDSSHDYRHDGGGAYAFDVSSPYHLLRHLQLRASRLVVGLDRS